MAEERLLQACEAILSKALDGRNLAALDLRYRCQASAYRRTIHQHRASTAITSITADFDIALA
jgi:hypothetical protein